MEQREGTDSCDSCRRVDTVSHASVFCYQCNEQLCDQCNKHHKMNKASSSHKTQSMTEVKDVRTLGMLKRLTQCPVHEAKRIKYLCKEHDELCCNECAIVKHRKCENVVSLDEEIERAKTDESQSTEEILKELASHADMLLRYEQTEKLEIESTEETCVKALATLKRNVEEAYKALEIKIREDAKKNRDVITKNIEAQKGDLERYKKELNESIHRLTVVKQIGQEVHMYITERELRLEVETFKEKLKDLDKQANNKKIVIDESSSETKLEICMRAFINVNVKSVRPSLPTCTVKGTCTSNPVKISEVSLKLFQHSTSRKYKKTKHLPALSSIDECLWLDNFLVILRDKTEVVLVDLHGQPVDTDKTPILIETNLQFDYQPVVTKVDEKTIAIANISDKYNLYNFGSSSHLHGTPIMLMVLDTHQKMLKRSGAFSTKKRIVGMTYDTGLQGLILLSNNWVVEFLNLEGKEIQTFTLFNIQDMSMSQCSVRHSFDSSSKILYVGVGDVLIATTLESCTVFEYKVTQSILAPAGLDAAGNIYLPTQLGLQQIDQKGKLLRTIEVSACAPKYSHVCFNTQKDKLVMLCDEKGKELKFFNMVP